VNFVDIVKEILKTHIPGSKVDVIPNGKGFDIEVSARTFSKMERADREALVYMGLQSLPLELVAKITGIKCVVEGRK